MFFLKKYLYKKDVMKNLKNTIFISYGTNKYEKDKFVPIYLNSPFAQINNKPHGGLWGSPVDSTNGWGDWAYKNEFHLHTLGEHFLFRIKNWKKIYIIDDIEDLKAISTKKNFMGFKSIDINRLISKYDGIYATSKAVTTLKNIEKTGYQGLDTWDVESICVFNPSQIEEVKEDYFTMAKNNRFGEIPYKDEEEYYNTDSNVKAAKKALQMKSYYERYGNKNIEKDMSKYFNGNHPGIISQGNGKSKSVQQARKFNGTIKSGMDEKKGLFETIVKELLK